MVPEWSVRNLSKRIIHCLHSKKKQKQSKNKNKNKNKTKKKGGGGEGGKDGHPHICTILAQSFHLCNIKRR